MQQYIDLLQKILNEGVHKEPAREGMPGTTSIFGYQYRHDLSKGFPLLTTKKMFWKGIVVELLWFLRGDTNIKYLVDNGVHLWDQDAYNYNQKVAKYPSKSLESFIDIIQTEDLRGRVDDYDYEYGDCGYQYGKVWRSFTSINRKYECKIDQIKNVIESLKFNPEGRRHIVTSIDPAHSSDLALYWCHALFQFNCRKMTRVQRQEAFGEWVVYMSEEELDQVNAPKYYLDCQLYQRSADIILGVPFNIASYALLTHLIALICNMVPGEFIHSFGDVHLYDNHIDAAKEQLSRDLRELPSLTIFGYHTDKAPYNAYPFTWPDHFDKYLRGRYSLDDFLKSLDPYDFRIDNYNPHPPIKAELSTGLKK